MSDCPTCADEFHKVDFSEHDFGKKPIRLMVASSEARFDRCTFRYTVSSRSFPEQAFIPIDGEICVASPVLCIVQSAQAYSLPRLMELCMELCGCYSLVQESYRGFVSRDRSLCNLESIERLLAHVRGETGLPKVRRAIQHVAEGARSPMETRAYLLVCLPKRMGGYGMPRPILNMRIELSEEEQLVSGRRYFECDMCWPDNKVVIEYDGHDDHASRADRNGDAIRRNILVERGYSVLTLTGQQICSMGRFDAVMKKVSRLIGYRLRAFPKDWNRRCSELRRELFRSMARYECERFS